MYIDLSLSIIAAMSLNRREFVEKGLLASAILLTGCRISSPKPTPSPEPTAVQRERFVDGGLLSLGVELSQWKLADGQLATVAFPEFRQVEELLLGSIDPRKYIPVINPPVRFNPGSVGTGFDLEVGVDRTDPRTITIQIPKFGTEHFIWIGRLSSVSLGVDVEALNAGAKLPAILNESSRLIDFMAYNRRYLALAAEWGVQFFMSNRKGSESPDETVFNFAHDLADLENQNHGNSFLDSLIGFGPAIRMGSIAFANWELERRQKGLPIPRNNWTRSGEKFFNFMKDRGYITQGRIFEWTFGSPPRIDSPEFLTLVKELSGDDGFRFK